MTLINQWGSILDLPAQSHIMMCSPWLVTSEFHNSSIPFNAAPGALTVTCHAHVFPWHRCGITVSIKVTVDIRLTHLMEKHANGCYEGLPKRWWQNIHLPPLKFLMFSLLY